MSIVNAINTGIRASALVLGSALAGVGMFASYTAYAGSGYLAVGAPLVALAAALIPAFAEYAWHHKQAFRAAMLMIVWVPCISMVLLNAIERNHGAKAGGEAERAALHTAADRAGKELTEAKAAANAATLAANKVRGLEKCGPKCQSIKATETAARARVADAEKALKAAEGVAVTESATKAPEWLLPLALEVSSIFLVMAGFGIGRRQAKEVPAPVEAPAVVKDVTVLTKRQIAARKGVETKRRNAKKAAAAQRKADKIAASNPKVAKLRK